MHFCEEGHRLQLETCWVRAKTVGNHENCLLCVSYIKPKG